jgi:RNA polymerase sigma-70 factor (ECF subfamily)
MKGNAILAISDEALMLKYAEGDIDAFEQLLERHRGPLFGYLCRILKNRELAEDTFQEVFVKVMKARAKYKKTAKFSTWLYRIARNAAIDALRRENYRKTESLSQPRNAVGDSDLTLQDAIPSSNPGPDAEFDRKQFSDALKKCIERLDPLQREVFVLRQYQNLPFREIASIAGATESTVKSRMRYALRNLRIMLIEESIVEEVAT